MCQTTDNAVSYAVAIAIVLLTVVYFAVRANGQCVGPNCSPLQEWRSPAIVPAKYASAAVRVGNEHPGGVSDWGSGGIVDIDEQRAIVVSNWHIYRDGMGKPVVMTADGRRFAARILGHDAAKDLVVLAIRPPKGVTPLTVSEKAPHPGERVSVYGFGTSGRLTVRQASVHGYQGTDLLCDGVTTMGDSGSPIVDPQGQLVAVCRGRETNGPTRCTWAGPVRRLLRRCRVGRWCDPPVVAVTPMAPVRPVQAQRPSLPPQPGDAAPPIADAEAIANDDTPDTPTLDQNAALDEILARNAKILERLKALEELPSGRGPPGKDGKPGRDGVDGKPGPPGPPGRDAKPISDDAVATVVRNTVDELPIYVELYDTSGQLIDTTTVSLGGTLKLQLYEQKRK